MTTTRNSLELLVGGVSTRANLISYWNTNTNLIDSYIAKSNWAAGAVDPDADNDDGEGYAAGSRWYTDTAIWECVDASTGTAVWHQIWPALVTELSGSVADNQLANSYAILAGRAGGQTLKGDTASGGNLTLQSTAHGTKGKIYFGSDYYDETLREMHVLYRLVVGTDIGSASTGMAIGNTSANVLNFFGQAADRCTGYGWMYNADAGSAFAWLYTYGYNNPIAIDGSYLVLQGNGTTGGVNIGEAANPGGACLSVKGTVKAKAGVRYTLTREANISIASGEVQSYVCPYGQNIEFANDTYGTTVSSGGFLVVT